MKARTRTFHLASLTLSLVVWLLHPQPAQCFYNPTTGRWLSRDPIAETGFQRATARPAAAGQPLQRLEPTLAPQYSFVNNSPLSATDALGLKKTCAELVKKAAGSHRNRALLKKMAAAGCPHVTISTTDDRLGYAGGGVAGFDCCSHHITISCDVGGLYIGKPIEPLFEFERRVHHELVHAGSCCKLGSSYGDECNDLICSEVAAYYTTEHGWYDDLAAAITKMQGSIAQSAPQCLKQAQEVTKEAAKICINDWQQWISKPVADPTWTGIATD